MKICISLSKRHFLSFFAILLTLANSEGFAQNIKPSERVPKAIVDQLLQVEGIGIYIKFDSDGYATNLVARPLNLEERNKQQILEVSGCCGEFCGNVNCATWIYAKTKNSYHLLLDAGVVESIVPQKAFSNGYRDVIVISHGSAWSSDLELYKFDGEKYRRKKCFQRDYSYLDEQGKLRELKRPRITKIRTCED